MTTNTPSIAVLVAAVLVVVASSSSLPLAEAQTPEQCGLYNTPCTPGPSGGEFFSTSLIVTGAYTGNISLLLDTFSDGNCTTGKQLSIEADGKWMDLGAKSDTDPSTRNWQVTYESVAVTPVTEGAAKQLSTACPCSGVWAKDTQRIIKSCPPNTCTDTTWLGGLKGNDALGINIGSPAFGFATVTPNISISWLDQQYVIGMGLNKDTDVWTNVQLQTDCGNPTHSDAFCGEWVKQCSPNFVDTAVASSGSFYYEGPKVGVFDSGIYREEELYFADNACANTLFSVVREGTWTTKSTSKRITGGYSIQQVVPYTIVRPYTTSMVALFKNECPCGKENAWAIGKDHVITACPAGTCSFEWLHNVTIDTSGLYTSNAIVTQRDDSVTELQRAYLTLNQFAADAQTFDDLSHPYTAVAGSCKYPYDSVLDVCGEWNQQCRTDAAGDIEMTLAFTGSAGDPSHGTGTGTIFRSRNIYPHNSGCFNPSVASTPTLKVEETGFWTDDGNDTTKTQGARQVIVRFVYTVVVPGTTAMAEQLNNHFLGCPCGGTWSKGVPRTLTSCPRDTCPDELDLFGAGALTVPGYGILRDQEDSIRMSALQDTPDGYAEQLQLTDLPFFLQRGCNPPEYSSDFVGNWFRPCSIDNANFEFTSHYYIQSDKSFNLTTAFYQQGFGCGQKEVMLIEQIGKHSYHGRSSKVSQATTVEFDFEAVYVTPITQEALNSLNQQCPCSVGASIWSLHKRTKLDHACPANTCTGFDVLRIPFGGVSYGIMMREDSFVRLSALNRDKTTGFNQEFTKDDFFFVFDDAEPPAPPGGRKHMDGGSVLLLLAFIAIVVYIVAGMALNYRNEGIPRVPHVEFWKGLPSLISDGFHFTLTKLGLGGSGQSYRRMVNPEAGSTNTTGYGAL